MVLPAGHRHPGRMLTRLSVILTAVFLAGCTSPQRKPTPSPPPVAVVSPSPSPSYRPWNAQADDPEGKAACDIVRALYEAGPIAGNRPNPGVDALATAAERGARSTLPKLVGASVDLSVQVRQVRAEGGRADDPSLVSAAYVLGRICHDERYYYPAR